jgi:hypothetical protein
VTRATLLHVLDCPTALGPAEVRELEQLAQAFPYCQTAHLLLAKAAHDQGTMLAGQRLRRAATYAADRTLLRRLIEQVAPATAEELVPPIPTPTSGFSVATIVPPHAPLIPQPVEVDQLAEAETPDAQVPAATVAATAVGLVVAAAPATPALPSAPVVEIEPALAVASAPEPLAAVAAPHVPPATASALPAAIEAVPESSVPEAIILPEIPEHLPKIMVLGKMTVEPLPLVDQEGAAIPVAVGAATALPEVDTALSPEEDLPAQAPAIRPPVEVGEARFEFGLAEVPPPAVPTYELPGLIDEWAASAVTRSMGRPDALTAAPVEPVIPVFTPAAFTGDATVGYAFGESSRLGFSMQLLDLLTARAETAESATAVVAAAQPPAGALPPIGTFFEPDLLLLDHWTTHCPPIPVLPSSLDLINNFLRRQPRLTRPAMLPPTAGTQADLSVRSTRAEPDLISENLARIFVRQGKIARAVEIYEKLMMKQPEKMAYFTAQIQSLQPSA